MEIFDSKKLADTESKVGFRYVKPEIEVLCLEELTQGATNLLSESNSGYYS